MLLPEMVAPGSTVDEPDARREFTNEGQRSATRDLDTPPRILGAQDALRGVEVPLVAGGDTLQWCHDELHRLLLSLVTVEWSNWASGRCSECGRATGNLPPPEPRCEVNRTAGC